MDTSHLLFPQINTALLVLLALISIYSLWVSWFNRVTIEILIVKIELMREENIKVKTENGILSNKVNSLPTLIATLLPVKEKSGG